MRGLYVWERPALVEANRQIMAERARLASPEATASEAQRRLLLRGRDIPPACDEAGICKWQFSVGRDRWLLVKSHKGKRKDCPWHSRAAVRGGVHSAAKRTRK